MPEATSRRDHIAMRTVMSISNRGARLELLVQALKVSRGQALLRTLLEAAKPGDPDAPAPGVETIKEVLREPYDFGNR